MLILLPIAAALCTLPLWLVLGRPRFLPATGDAASADSISIIIPARDEEANIGALLASILNQSITPREVIVVDDHSSDRTAALAAEAGATVIQPPGPPPDWKGKTWACQQGAQAAIGSWFLFLDADTRLEQGALEKISRLTRNPGRVSSICPYHAVERPYEQLSAFFNVVVLAGINAFGIQRDPSRESALFGQCLLIHHDIYQKIGGHRSVRRDILENFQLASHLEAHAIPRDCYLGRGTIRMRMFPGGFRELWSSWKKGFSSGAGSTAPSVLVFTSLWITGAMLACVALAFMPFATPACQFASAAAYLFCAAHCLFAFRLAGSFSLLNALFFPVSLFFYQTLFFTSVIERRLGIRTRWKGRHVD
jgi:4,4'-diaponeurosporenoate glycosyltransferase